MTDDDELTDLHDLRSDDELGADPMNAISIRLTTTRVPDGIRTVADYIAWHAAEMQRLMAMAAQLVIEHIDARNGERMGPADGEITALKPPTQH